RRRVLREGQLEARVRVHVAVGHVVHDLPDGPAVWTVGSIELAFVEAGDGRAKVCWRRRNRFDRRTSLVGSERLRPLVASDGKAQIFHGNLRVALKVVDGVGCRVVRGNAASPECTGLRRVLDPGGTEMGGTSELSGPDLTQGIDAGSIEPGGNVLGHVN